MKKRILSFLLAFSMVLSLIPAVGFAEDGNKLAVLAINKIDTETCTVTDEAVDSAKPGDVIALTIGVKAGSSNISVAGYQFQLNFDGGIFALWSQTTHNKNAFYKKVFSTANIESDATLWSEPTGGRGDDYISLATTYVDSTEDYTSLNYNVTANGTMDLVQIALQVKADVESCATKFEFDSTYETLLVYYANAKSDQVSELTFEREATALTINGVTPTLTSVSLPEGSDTVTVAGSGDPQTIQATATSLKGTDLTTSVAWSVSPADGGVSIDAAAGVITVANNAKAGNYTITVAPKDGKVQGEAKTATLEVVRDRQPGYIYYSLESKTVDIPVAGTNTVNLITGVYDQFDEVMNDASVTFDYSELYNISGVRVQQDGNRLSVSVTPDAKTPIKDSRTYTINVSYEGLEVKTVQLTIQRGKSVPTRIAVSDIKAVEIPTDGSAVTRPVAFNLYDQYGTSIVPEGACQWSISPEGNGIQLDASFKSGTISITRDAIQHFNGKDSIEVTVTVTADGVTGSNTLTLTRKPSTVASASVEGGASVAFIPVGDQDVTTEFYAMGTDQYGQPMGDRLSGVEWSISPAVNGVSIDKSTGVVTVTKNAKIAIADSQDFTVTATQGEVRGTKTITVKRAESVATSLTVALTSTTQGPFVVPGRDASEVYIDFTATVLDQYGSAMQNQNVTWSILQGTTVLENDNKIMSIFDGRVNVANAAKKYVPSTDPVTFTVKAELGGLSNTAEFQLKRADSVLDSFNLYKREGTNGEFALVSQDMIVVPSDDTTKTFQYMAKPVDQYGAEMDSVVPYALKLWRKDAAGNASLVSTLVLDANGVGTLNVAKNSPTTKTETLEIGIHAANDKNAFYKVTFSHKDPVNVTVGDKLTLTYGDERGITATVENASTKAKWTWTSSDTSVVTASGNTKAATLRAHKAGSATITVTYEDDSRYGTATIEVTVAKKTLTVSAGSYKLSKQYTGKTAGVHGSGELQVNGLVNGDKPSDVIYIYTEEFPTANAGSGEMDVKVRVYPSGAGDWKDKYQLEAASAEDGTVLVKVPYTITPAPLTIGTGSFKSRTYDPANNSAEVETLTLNGAVSNDKLVLGTDYEVTEVRVSNNNVGTQRVSFKVTLKNSNYKWTADDEHVCEVPESAGFTVEITKAPHENATASGSAKYGNTAVVDISSYLPAGYHIGIITTGGDLSVFSNWSQGESSFSVSLANNPANVGKQVTFTLPISSTNYENFDLVITVTVNDKLENSLAARDISLTYGDTGYVTVTSIIGSLRTEIVSGDDVISLDNGTIKTLKAGEATLKLTASGDENYAEKSIQVKVTVSPKPITLTIDSKSAYVNDAQPALTYKVNGLVGADTLTTEPVLFVDAAEGVDPMKQVGTYAIKTSVTPSAGDNYSLTVAEGTLSVTNRPSAITPVGPSAGTVRVDETEGGTVRVTPANAAEGSTVTIVVTPDQGQELRSLEVLDKDGDSLELTDLGGGRFSFEMPSGKVTVKAEFGKAGLPYDDVKEGDWFYSAVEYVTEAGLMGDTGHGSFEPNTNTTRAMIWAILARLSGADTTPVSGPWYSVAQEWAMNSGVSDGTNPNGAITREQLVTMLYRYAETHGIDVTEGGMAIREFADVERVSSFAGPAMTWAVNTGLISGIDGKLVPQGLATRSQVATVLMRFAQLAK